jgi:Flp pilus assembly pilin Flp
MSDFSGVSSNQQATRPRRGSSRRFQALSKPIAPSKSSNFLAAGQRRNRTAQRRKEVSEVSKRYHQLVALKKREDGQTMAEYGVVLAVITIAVFGALTLLSGNIVTAIGRVAGFIS